MPPKRRATRNTKAKAPVALSPEDQQLRDQCSLLLADFDKQCEGLKSEAAREAKTAADSISTLYRLEMMKIPMDVKTMKWQEYYEQHAGPSALGLSTAVSEAMMDDSVMEVTEAVESQVSLLKSAIKNTTVKKSRRKKEPEGDENEQPATGSRTSSRRRVANRTLQEFETPATSSRATARTVLETPAARPPLLAMQTPLITPKFDTRYLGRTVSRVAKAGEMLVSLSGSPVAPSVGPRSKAAKELASQNALIPLGDGSTLNMPLAEQGLDMTVDLDAEQLAKLEQLHRNIGNMLKMKLQTTADVSTLDN